MTKFFTQIHEKRGKLSCMDFMFHANAKKRNHIHIRFTSIHSRLITINHDLFTKNFKLATLISEGGVGASGHRFTVWWKKEKKNFEWKIGSQDS